MFVYSLFSFKKKVLFLSLVGRFMVVGQCGLVGGLLGLWVGCWIRGVGGLVVVVCQNWWLWFAGIVVFGFGLLKFWVVEIGLVFAGIVGWFAGLLKSVCWNCGLLKSVCWNCQNWLDVISGFASSTGAVIGSQGCGCGGRGGLYLVWPMVCVACDR